MSKKVVIVEDCPWRMKDAILKMNDMHIEVEAILFYCGYPGEKTEAITKKIEQFIEATGITPKEFSYVEKNERLDEYYEQQNTVLFLDVILKPDEEARYLKEWISIQYANKKREEDMNASKKIYFYTTGDETLVNRVAEIFPGQVINVLDLNWDGQIELDMDKVRKIVGIEDDG